jgi:1,4-dihydroxy-2-naphthoate octaprenyltransferase
MLWRLVDLLSYVRPVFFAPAVAMSVYGGLLAPATAVDAAAGALRACLVGLTLFVMHLQDGYVDGHRRGEETSRLGVAGFGRAIRLGSVGVVALTGILW